MIDFTFLELDDVLGDKKLDVFRKTGEMAKATDFAIMLGAQVPIAFRNNMHINKLEMYASWWTKTDAGYANNYFIDAYGHESYKVVSSRFCGARPVIRNISKLNLEERIYNRITGLTYVEFGEYPGTVAGKEIVNELITEYNKGTLRETGRTFTADDTYLYDNIKSFKERKFKEYEYNGKKYIRVVATDNCDNNVLSDGTSLFKCSSYWMQVEPVKWLVDKKRDLGVSERILFAGIQYDNRELYGGIDFENSDIKWFIDNFFKKEMLADIIYDMVDEKDIVCEDNNKINPYNFDYTEVTEEEIIKGAVESNVAVFLHGRSSEGKSARVKQIDPDCEIIYLRNATPDSLNGKSVFNSEINEMIDIPPTWYKKVVDKCASEPDKIHIIFFDEITNALPSIQGMAFNIVLNGEVNGKWKLPENARIVAAGNDLEESKAANEMSEPLFNRFAHVYINTTVDSWLKWASTPDEEYERLDYTPTEKHPKIHPAIYAYIAYKSYSKQDVLRTPYNGKTPNADPRKWEMSSKVLYKTKKPEMLRSLIGEGLTRDFTAFCSRQVLCVEDVINGNYNESTFDMDVSEKFNTAVGLSSVPIEHIEVVRNFVMKLGPEICATFDTLWIHGDESRLEKIAEIKLSERTK